LLEDGGAFDADGVSFGAAEGGEEDGDEDGDDGDDDEEFDEGEGVSGGGGEKPLGA
jgi:hypothetical protein